MKYSPLVLRLRSRRAAETQAEEIRKVVLPDVQWLEVANRTHNRPDRADLAAQAAAKLTEAAALLDRAAGIE